MNYRKFPRAGGGPDTAQDQHVHSPPITLLRTTSGRGALLDLALEAADARGDAETVSGAAALRRPHRGPARPRSRSIRRAARPAAARSRSLAGRAARVYRRA